MSVAVRRETAQQGSSAPLGSTLDFMRLLWAMDHGLQRRSKRMEVELGVTGMQRVVIRLIGRFPAITAGRLAEDRIAAYSTRSPPISPRPCSSAPAQCAECVSPIRRSRDGMPPSNGWGVAFA